MKPMFFCSLYDLTAIDTCFLAFGVIFKWPKPQARKLNKEANLRTLALASALLIGSLSLVPTADAARRHHRTVTVQLPNGRTVTFRLMRIGGRMMMVAPMSAFGPEVIGGQ
jgi:hypothetical protein